MPTGYTSDLYDDKPQSFEEFALSCAHAFGALVTLRDSPRDAEIPEFVPDTSYYDGQTDKGTARLAEARAWTDEEVEALALADFDRAIDAWQSAENEKAAKRQRYEDMLAAVEAWQPPTPDHVELKKFMGDQLRESIDFDCRPRDAPLRRLGSEYRADVIERAERDIAYGVEHRAAEIERVEQRNEWVKALRDSLAVLYPSKRWLLEARHRAEAGFARDATEWTNAKIAQERTLQIAKRARVLIEAIDEHYSSPFVEMAIQDLRESIVQFQIEAQAARARPTSPPETP